MGGLLIKSHVSAPATYLSNFRIQQGMFRDNSDPLYVYDKFLNSYDKNKNTRGDWIENFGFFSENIEKFNGIFENRYPSLYKAIIKTDEPNDELTVENIQLITEFIANIRARLVSENLELTIYQDSKKRNDIVPIMTNLVSRGYKFQELFTVRVLDGYILTSDWPLLSITPTSMIGKFVAIRVLPIDFTHMLFLSQCRYEKDIPQLRSVLDYWFKNQTELTYWICYEQILQAKRYIIFHDEKFLKDCLKADYVQNKMKTS